MKKATPPLTKKIYRNKSTAQEYELIGTFECIAEREFPRDRYLQSGKFRRVSNEALFLSEGGYFTVNGTDHGSLIFYQGVAGKFVRTVSDFENTFDLISG